MSTCVNPFFFQVTPFFFQLSIDRFQLLFSHHCCFFSQKRAVRPTGASAAAGWCSYTLVSHRDDLSYLNILTLLLVSFHPEEALGQHIESRLVMATAQLRIWVTMDFTCMLVLAEVCFHSHQSTAFFTIQVTEPAIC